MPTQLTLASNTQRITPITGVTPAQSRVRQTLGGLNQAYKALAMTQKGGWQTIANTLNAQQTRTGKHKLHPSNAFVTLNSARLACGLPILADAPADLSAPPLLPPITVQTRAAATDAAFTLTLACTGYSHAVQILAAPPAPAGKPTFPDSAFSVIGFLPGLASGDATDIALLYQNAYGTPEPGSQIALKLVAVAESGLRLTPLVLVGIVAEGQPPSEIPLPNREGWRDGASRGGLLPIPAGPPSQRRAPWNFSPPPIRSQTTPGTLTPAVTHDNHAPPTT